MADNTPTEINVDQSSPLLEEEKGRGSGYGAMTNDRTKVGNISVNLSLSPSFSLCYLRRFS